MNYLKENTQDLHDRYNGFTSLIQSQEYGLYLTDFKIANERKKQNTVTVYLRP